MATTKIIEFTIFGYIFTLHKKKVYKHISKKPNPYYTGDWHKQPDGKDRYSKWIYTYPPKIKD